MPKGDVYTDNAVNRRLGRVGKLKSPDAPETQAEREAFKEARSKNSQAILGLEPGEETTMKSKDGKTYRAKRSTDGTTLSFFVVNVDTDKEKKVKEIPFKEKK